MKTIPVVEIGLFFPENGTKNIFLVFPFATVVVVAALASIGSSWETLSSAAQLS